MPRYFIDAFKGLYTSADQYSADGSPDLKNVNIDANGDIEKAKGFEILDYENIPLKEYGGLNSFFSNLTNDTFINYDEASYNFDVDQLVTVYSRDNLLYEYNFVDDGFIMVPFRPPLAKGRVYRVTGRSNFIGNYYNLDATQIKDVDFPYWIYYDETGSFKINFTVNAIYRSLVHTTPFAPTEGLSVDDINILGSIEYNNEIVAMISNGTNAYLCKTSKTLLEWECIETSYLWDANNRVNFVVYADTRTDKNYLIWVNGEEGATDATGGVYYWDGTTTGAKVVDVFGSGSVPTGNVIEVHNERLWVGNIADIGGTTYSNASHWLMVSKQFPEPADTQFAIGSEITTATINKGQSTKITVTWDATQDWTDSVAIGDFIYITGVNGDLGREYLNGKYHRVLDTTSTEITIDTDTSGALDLLTAGTFTLRGETWSPAIQEFEDTFQGAGIIRLDNNTEDNIVQVKSGFGVLTIFRKNSIYFFTGDLSSGNFSLARRMTLPYGASSSSVALSESGIWFTSQYGISKIEGVTVQSAKTELDNITSLTYSQPIKPNFDAINLKSNLELQITDRYLWVHDRGDNNTYILDFLTKQWTLHDFKKLERIIFDGEKLFGLYKGLVFIMDKNYASFNVDILRSEDIEAYYKTPIIDFDNSMSFKQYKQFKTLIEGSTSATDLILWASLYYDGDAIAKANISYDIKTAGQVTWDSLTSNSTLTWNQVTNSGAKTWVSIIGDIRALLQRRSFDLGTSRELQFKFSNTSSSYFRISNFTIEYDIIEE